MLNKTYGSFFGLELGSKSNLSISPEPLFLNTGRNAFEYIIRTKKPDKVYLPALSCEALYTPLNRLNIPYNFYNVDSNFEPIFDFSQLKTRDWFLYINYYGLKDPYIINLQHFVNNLILDYTQAFYSNILPNIPTFNSLRKFFGVPDGSMLFNCQHEIELEKDSSAERFLYLIKRLECDSNSVYSDYREVEKRLDTIPLLKISDSTLSVFSKIPFDKYRNIRRENFSLYHDALEKINKLTIKWFNAPHFYPLFIENGRVLKEKLIDFGIFTPSFWPNITENPKTSLLEKELAFDVIPLPIDQRYNKDDIDYIVKKIVDSY